MTITAESPFLVTRDRISRDAFARLLREQAAPGVAAERDPGQYYDANQWIQTLDGRHVDALFILAMFHHESSMGKAGVARQTHSWGNTRAPTFGAPTIGDAPGASGTFPVFRDWLDGMKSTSARLVTDQWVYSGPSRNAQTGQTYGPRTTIRAIFDHPSGQVWAPVGDMNDPAGYLRAMLDFMNAHADQDGETEMPGGRYPKPDVDTSHPSPNHDGYSQPRDIRLIVHHISDDRDIHRVLRYFSSAGTASSNYVVALDGTIYEVVPPESAPWTNGPVQAPDLSNPIVAAIAARSKPNANPYSLTIEYIGKPQDSLTPEQIASGQRLVAWASGEYDLPIDRTHNVGHYQIDSIERWYCPTFSDAEWSALLDGARALASGADPMRVFPETGHGIGGGFRWFWEHNGGLPIFGYPLTDELQEDGRTVQYFERAVFEYHPENSDPWKVLLRRIGAEALARRAA